MGEEPQETPSEVAATPLRMHAQLAQTPAGQQILIRLDLLISLEQAALFSTQLAKMVAIGKTGLTIAVPTNGQILKP